MPAAKKTTETTANDRNMRFYVQVQDTPKEAQKSFNNGRFTGTDINPMWRIKMLTQMFGPAGIGWWTEDEQYIFEPCTDTGEIAVFCTLHLLYRDPETGEISHPVSGIGGNKFLVSQRNGKYCNDEAYKMAYTDALSIACKSLGFSHDIYYQADRTKYTMSGDTQPEKQEPKENKHTEQSVDLIAKIDARFSELSKTMPADEKNKFWNENVIKVFGGTYKKSADVEKLTALYNKVMAA